MKKCTCIVLSLILFFISNASKGTTEEMYIRVEDLCYSDQSGGTLYMAVTDQYAVYAEGTFSDKYYLEWCPNEFTVSIETLSTGEKVNIDTFPSSWVSVLSDGKVFYIAESNFINEKYTKPVSVRIGILDPDTKKINWHERIVVEKENYQILDVQLIHGKLYLIFLNHIQEYDPVTAQSTIIYENQYKLKNDLYENHAQVYQNQLIFHTGGSLESIDVITGDVKFIASVDTIENYIDCRAPNAYYVMGNKLIFSCSYHMYIKDLLTGRINELLPTEFRIYHAASNGLYVDLSDRGYGTYFYTPETQSVSLIPANEFNMRDILIDLAKNYVN